MKNEELEKLDAKYFLTVDSTVKRLFVNYLEHGNLSIGFDFDNTLYDCHKLNLPHIDICIKMMKMCEELELDLCVWTHSPDDRFQYIREYLSQHKISKFLINTTKEKYKFYKDSKKPFFSLLLDDRSGLEHSISVLEQLLILIDKRKNLEK